MLKIGIIGCGTIGAEIAEAVVNKFFDKAELTAVCDVSIDNAKALLNKIEKEIPILSLQELIAGSDLVIESACAEISADIVAQCITNKKDVMVMSTAGLIGKVDILEAAAKGESKVYMPSGAICGMDGVKAAAIGKIDNAVLTTRKPPVSIEGAPYIIANNIDLKTISEEKVIFEGSVGEAVKGFPKNINVSATFSLVCLLAGRDNFDIENIKVRIITSPEYTNNIHEIELRGDFGRLVTKTENVHSTKNHKTSQMAIFSAIATLKGILENIKIGT